MKLIVKVIPRAKKESVIPGDPLKVRVTAPAESGKANQATIVLLAKHFGVKKQNVHIVSGLTSKKKHITINT